jgi:GLPGLI family protein
LEITRGAKEILITVKATTEFAGRTYVAWYTTEISIADGPYKFYGLLV